MKLSMLPCIIFTLGSLSHLLRKWCVDDACAHDACPPAINYAIELMYASAAFQMKELVLLFQISYICSRMSSCYLVSDNDTSFLI
ncbi:hypothetical protein AB3S75_035072 [Citrus x aurantiifolia]